MRRRSTISRLLSLFLLSPLFAVTAQQPSHDATGRIVGRVIDAASGAGISDAGVQVVGTMIAARSGVDGRYTLTNVPVGTVTLQTRRIGYATKQITGLLLDAGKSLEQNISLIAATVQLE